MPSRRPPPPVQLALATHALDLALEAADARADQPAVRLELRLAGAARPDRALEALEVLPLAAQARQQVLVLRQLDLQRRLAAVGPAREDVEDERAAVQHLDLERGLEPQLLGRRELLVEDHERVPGLGARRADLLELAAADVGRGVGTAPLQCLPHHGRAGGAREPRQLAQRLARGHQRLLAVVQADEVRVLLCGGRRVHASVGAGAVLALRLSAVFALRLSVVFALRLSACAASRNGALPWSKILPYAYRLRRARTRSTG